MSKPKEILNLYEQYKQARVNLDNTAQEIIDNILPYMSDVTITRAPGEKKNSRIFDASASYGHHVFSQFVQGSIINPGQKWFALHHRDNQADEKQAVAGWNQDSRDRMLRLMRTAFYGPAGQAIDNWAGFGNGPLLIEAVPKKREGLGPIRFTSVPYGQSVMAEGDDGRIDQFIRCMKIPAHQAVKLGDVSTDIQKAAEKEPLREFEILHSILPRDMQEYSKSAIKGSKDLPWASCWVEKEKGKLIKESGYRKFPVAIARYALISGSPYARGLAELALPDAKTLNLADQKALLKWDRELDPPTLTQRNSLVSKILDKRAGGNTIVNNIDKAVAPLFDSGNWQSHDLMAGRKELAILRIFHVNEILNLLSREKPELTAFEVNARLTLLQQILGPVFGILESEFLSQIVELTLDNMAHMGLLAQPPDEIAQGDGDILDVIYEGPLARAQRNGDIQNIQQSVADVVGIQPLWPEVVKLPDWEKMTRNLFAIRGTQHLLIGEQEFLEEQTKLVEQANADKAAALVGGGSEALGKIAPYLKVQNDISTGRAAA